MSRQLDVERRLGGEPAIQVPAVAELTPEWLDRHFGTGVAAVGLAKFITCGRIVNVGMQDPLAAWSPYHEDLARGSEGQGALLEEELVRARQAGVLILPHRDKDIGNRSVTDAGKLVITAFSGGGGELRVEDGSIDYGRASQDERIQTVGQVRRLLKVAGEWSVVNADEWIS